MTREAVRTRVGRAAAAARGAPAAVRRGGRRIRSDLGPLLQGTAAATIAWLLARVVLGRPDPFFAPIAALVALNTSVGERGLNALRVLVGVLVGIVVGEVTLALLGGGFGSIAIAVFAATAIARGMNAARVVIAQAGSSAILAVAIGQGEAGIDRLTDALIGAGVALAFTQLLFSPQPLVLLRQAESAALRRMASALALTARALAGEDDGLAPQAVSVLRELPHDLVELRRRRLASARVARRTLAWRSQRELVVRENENADHIDLLGSSCLALARAARSVRGTDRAALATTVRTLADVIADLAAHLGDRTVRQRAAERAFDVATGVSDVGDDRDWPLQVAATAAEMTALDVMVVAGVDLDGAVAAVRDGIFERRVPAPPAQARGLLGWLRSRFART